MLEVRSAAAADAPALVDIFYRGVHEGAAPKYSVQQRAAWLPARPEPEAYWDRLAGQHILVAEVGGAVSGFMTLTSDGYLDFAYVLPEMRGKGLADTLLAVLENHAIAAGHCRLTTRASHMARPFFARHGWQVTEAVTVERGGVRIEATNMARDLPALPENAIIQAAE